GGFAVSGDLRPLVYDTPGAGAIDALGGLSLGLYRRLAPWERPGGLARPGEGTRVGAGGGEVDPRGGAASPPRAYPPPPPPGAEWSALALARGLAARGQRVVVVTPNYGAPPREDRDGVAVRRFPFPRRLPPGRATVPVRFHANPAFYGYAALMIARTARAERARLIHVQNKQMLIPGVVAGALVGRPVALTIRDGGIIDAAPVCLLHGDRMPVDCGARKLWRECSVEYFDRYVKNGGRLRTRLAFWYLWLDAR